MILTLDELRTKYSFYFSSDSEPMFQSYLDTAEEAVLSYADIESGEVCEYFENSRRLPLTHGPVREVCSVEADGHDLDFRYEPRAHLVVLLEESSASEIVVHYEVGYFKWPAVIKQAVALTVQHLAKLQNAKQMGILSRSTEGGTETIEQTIPPIAVKALLDRYRGVIL